MTAVVRIPVQDIPPLDHDEAVGLADVEISRLLALVDDLRADEWQRPIPSHSCTIDWRSRVGG